MYLQPSDTDDRTGPAPRVDCFGLRWLRPDPGGRTDELIIAEPTAALHMRQTSGPFDRDYAPCGAPVGVVAAVATHQGPVHVLEAVVGDAIAASVQLGWAGPDGGSAKVLPGAVSSLQQAIVGSFALAHLLWPCARIVQVGDTASFVRRGDRFDPILPAEPDAGRGEAAEGEPRSVTIRLSENDEIVLCSAPVSPWVRSQWMATALARVRTVEEACQELLSAAAAERGSGDMTAVVARFTSCR